jgi:hypothetical protein
MLPFPEELQLRTLMTTRPAGAAPNPARSTTSSSSLMFALIETKGATHIAIHIPAEGADKTIPALVGMLEENAVFVCRGYSQIETRTPEMSIQLGDKLFFANSDEELAIVIPSSASVLDDSFVKEAPEVKISNQKAIDRRDAEIKRLRTELEHTKQQLQDLQERINAVDEIDQD